MGYLKSILKIILVIQLLTCALAYHNHPDAETIDFGSPSQPSRDQLIIEAAIKRGMDGEAVAELLRNRIPVIRTTTTPGGFNKTTTYKLEPDGSITSKSVLKSRNRYIYNSDSAPDSKVIENLRQSPSGTVTRTFTDSDGSQVTQTIAVNKSEILRDDIDDWFNKPFPSWPAEAPSAPSSGTLHRTITRTFSGPNESGSGTHTNWPGLNYPSFSKPWHSRDPEDADDWELVKHPEVESTTKRKLESWTPKTWEWPQFPTHPTTSTTRTTITTTTAQSKKPKETLPKLPTLEDFLRKQYATSTQRSSTQSSTSKSLATNIHKQTFPTTTTATTEPKMIRVEDLPITDILYNGRPAGEDILKSLPPHLLPRPQTEQVLKIENKRPIEQDIEVVYTPKLETNIRTYSKTHIGPEKPSIKDLIPEMQDLLRRAGISPDDITNIEGDTITKTRKEPDGRVIKTTYKVNTVSPVEPVKPTHTQHHFVPPQAIAPSFNFNTPIIPPLTPFSALTPPHISPIAEFLAKLGLTKSDITSRNGRYTKTFIDDNGEVLTATFVLSSPKGVAGEDKPQVKPLK